MDLGLLNRIVIDDVEVYDQNSKQMIIASRLAAKVDYYQLIRNGCVYISSAQIFGLKGIFYKKDKISKPNYQFVLDSLASKDKSKKSNLMLSINSLIIRHSSIKYDREDIPCTPSHFNLNHLDLNNISAHFIVPYYTNDSASVIVKKLSLDENSGFGLKDLKFDLKYNKSKAEIENFKLLMPNSEIYANGLIVNYQYKNNKPDIQSVKYSGDINIKRFSVSDIKCFIPKLKYSIKPLSLNISFTGDYNSLSINRLNLYSDGLLSLNANGKISKHKSSLSWHANVSKLECNLSLIHI